MNNVKKIIDLFGGLDKFEHVRIDNAGYMPLCIERVGKSINGPMLIAVAHYSEQNGDLMADPDMTFEVAPDHEGHFRWSPYSFQNDSVGLYQEVYYRKTPDGPVMIRPKLLRDLRSFAATWNQNIGEQGFVEAARKLAESRATSN